MSIACVDGGNIDDTGISVERVRDGRKRFGIDDHSCGTMTPRSELG